MSYNQITDTTLAFIHDETVMGAGVSINATNHTLLVAAGGSAAIVSSSKGTSVGIAGSYAQNNLLGSTSAFVDNSSLTLTGDLLVDSATSGQMISVSASGAMARGQKGIAVAGQVSINNVGITTLAQVLDQSGVTANNVSATASSSESIFAVAGAVSFGGKAGIGAAVSLNNIPSSGQDSVWAGIQDSDVQAGGAINLQGQANQTIQTITAAIGDAQTGMAAAAAISINAIAPDTEVFVRRKKNLGMGIQDNSGLTMTATDTSTIDALAGGVALTGGAGGFGLSVALNTIGSNSTPGLTESMIQGTSVASAQGMVTETASATSSIEVLAIGGSGAKNKDGVAVDAGAAAAVNAITSAVLATIDSTTATVLGVEQTASAQANIDALALGLGGAIQGGFLNFVGLNLVGAGSGSGNSISRSVEASIRNGSSVTTGSLGSLLTATDTSSITAASGAAALAIGKSGLVRTSGAIGVSVADNSIGTSSSPNLVTAGIENSTVQSGGGIALNALAAPTILAVTVAGGAAIAKSRVADLSFAGAGAASQNTIAYTVQAVINAGSTVSSGAGQAITLTARDNSNITADAGGVSLGLASGGDVSGTDAQGAAVAVNSIGNTVLASINNASVTSAGGLDLTATTLNSGGKPGESIFALTLGVAGALASGGEEGVGIGLGGAGSGSNNQVHNTVEASIRGSHSVTAQGSITLTAQDSADITAAAGAAALALA